MKWLYFMIFVSWLIFTSASSAEVIIYDDFEDNVIDSSMWLTQGRKGGYGGLGAGNWQYSFNEITVDDGYLEARVWGPTSGMTYFGEASVRTTYNFNDGRSWLINFTWETSVGFSPAFDCFGIQITNGNLPLNDNCYWIWNELPPGTVNLWYSLSSCSPNSPPQCQEPLPPFSKRTWSIRIDPGQSIASFYRLPNGVGSPQSHVSLDPSCEWYIKFVQVDATAAGLPAGDNTFKLYNFSAVSVPIYLNERTFIQGIEVSGQRPIRGIALGPDESKLYAAYWTYPPSPVAVYSTTDLIKPLYLETDPDYPLLDKMSYGKCHGGVAGSYDGQYLFTPSYYQDDVSRFDISVLDPNVENTREGLAAGDWPWGIGISPDGCKLVVQAGCDGRSYDMNNDALNVYDICDSNFSLLCTVPLDDEPEIMGPAFSDDSRFVYITTHKRKSSKPRLYEVSITPPYAVTRYLEFPNPSNRLGSVTTNGQNLYVSDTDNSRVWVVDPLSWSVIDYIELTFAPWGISMHPDGQHLFVLPWYELIADYISVFDVNTKALVGRIDGIHHGAELVVFTQDGQTAYVAHSHATEGGITVLDIRKLHLLLPKGGESLVADTTYTISWETCASIDVDYIVIEYSTDSGQTWQEIDTVANSGIYEWNPIPAVTSNQCLVRISDVNDANICDVSDDVFTIFECRRSDVIYSQDFSYDPGWFTNLPSKMYWDQQKGKYHFEITGLGEYAFVPIEYSSAQSYTLEFDIEIVRLEYNSSISFGLYDPDMREQEPVNWKANYGRGDGGNGASIGYFGDSSSGAFPPGYDFTYQVNTDYHNVIVYDATAQKLTWQVTRISDGTIVADYSSPDGIGTFTGIDRICVTRVPQGAITEGYIDNVALSASYIGKLVGDLNNDCYSDFRDFAVFAGHWLECGNPFDPDCGID